MSEPENKIQRLARKLGCSPENASRIRDQFNQSEEYHVLLQDRIEALMEEKRRTYDTITPEELKKLQGHIDGLTKALAAINAKE